MKSLCLLMTIWILLPVAGFAEGDAHAQQAPPLPLPPPAPAEQSGLTLELQGVNILDIFKTLSKKSGLNIVAGKNVQGQVSIFLQNVPVREVLQTILQSQALAAVEEGNIVKIMTEEEYLKRFGRPYRDQRRTKAFHLDHASAELLAAQLSEIKSSAGKIITAARTNHLMVTELPEILKEMEALIREADRPRVSEVFSLRHARVEDLEINLKGILEGGGGKVELDKRSNRLVVTDIPSKIAEVRTLVDAFDIQVPQVLIEAKIVEVKLGDSYRQGINWELILKEVGSINTLKAAAPLVVAPPAGAAALSTLALGGGDDDVKVVLDLLERVGKTNLLSSPRITVLDNQEAKLAVATKQPFVSQTVIQTVNATNTADNVQFVDVGVTLRVQPRISYDDFVEMKIRPEVSSSNETLELESVSPGSETAFTRSVIPVVTSQELETTVLIKSQTTIVIGGLIQDRQEKQTSKVPFLGSIPFFGRAFHSKANDFSKSELVIFLTPTVLKPDVSTSDYERFVEMDKTIKKFEEFGGYPFRATYAHPGRHLQAGEVPYWEAPRDVKEWIYPLTDEGSKKNADGPA